MLSDILKVVVCGPEHSGTTLVAQLLRQHPDLETGFEVGALLYNSIEEYFNEENPWSKDWDKRPSGLLWSGWKLSPKSREKVLKSASFEDFYNRLRQHSPLIRNKEAYLIDKTPRYYLNLGDVAERTQCKLLVTQKDPILLFASKYIQKSFDVNQFVNWYSKLRQNATNIVTNRPDQIRLVKYENLVTAPHDTMRGIFDFIGMEAVIKDEFESDWVEKTGNRVWDASKLDELYYSVAPEDRKVIQERLSDYLAWNL